MSEADPVAAARELLPGWVPWANVLVLVPVAAVASGLAALVTGAIASAPLRRAVREAKGAELPWHERTRLAWPLLRSTQRVAFLAMLVVPALALLASGPVAHVSSGWLWALLLAVVFRSIRLALRPFRLPRESKAVSFRQWIKALGFVLLLYARLPVIAAMAVVVGPELDVRACVEIAVGLGLVVLLSTGSWLWLAEKARIVGPPSERLLAAVRAAAERVGAPMPKSLEADVAIANAFALPRQRTLVVTRAALEILDDEELAAVCAHELGHLTEPSAAALFRPFAIVAVLPIAFVQVVAARFEDESSGFLLAALICVSVALLATFAVRLFLRHFEGRADRIAHAHEGSSGAYVRALAKLHRASGEPLTWTRDPTKRPGLLSRIFARDPHGSFAERVHALGGEIPAGLRPPSRARYFAALGAGMATLLVAFFGGSVLIYVGPAMLLEHEGATELSAGLDGSADSLRALGDFREARGALDEAIVFKRAAAAVSDGLPYYSISLAETLIEAGRLDEAEAALDEAERSADPRFRFTWTDYLQDVRTRLEDRRAVHDPRAQPPAESTDR